MLVVPLSTVNKVDVKAAVDTEPAKAADFPVPVSFATTNGVPDCDGSPAVSYTHLTLPTIYSV